MEYVLPVGRVSWTRCASDEAGWNNVFTTSIGATKAANNQNLAKKTEPAIEAEKTKVKVKVNDTAAEDKRATSPTTTETTGPPAQASLEQPWKTLKT